MWSHLIYHSAGDENSTGIAAQDTANALAVLAQAVRGVAAGTKNARTQEYILSTAQQVSGCGHMGGCGHPVKSVAAGTNNIHCPAGKGCDVNSLLEKNA